jgi:Tfp pilus assembly protein PilO
MNRNVISIILIILAVGGYMTFTSGKIDEVKALQQSNDQYQAAIDKADELIKVRDKLLKDYNSISDEDKERLDKMIPSMSDNIRLAIDLNNLAFKYGYNLRGISISGAEKKLEDDKDKKQTVGPGSIEPIVISFSVTSSFVKFKAFMQEMESNLRIMDLNSLSMTVSDTGLYDFSVQYTTYWLKQ